MTLEIVSIIAGCMSVALGLVALWLSVSFYHRGKDTEKHVKQLGDQTATDYRLLTNLIHSNFDEATIRGTSPTEWTPTTRPR